MNLKFGGEDLSPFFREISHQWIALKDCPIDIYDPCRSSKGVRHRWWLLHSLTIDDNKTAS